MPAIIILLALLFTACATKTITFSTSEKATVSLVPPNATDGKGQVIGETPTTVELAKLEGKVVKISGDGLVTQYWIVHEPEGSDTKVALKLEKRDDKKDDQKKDDGKQAANTKNRLMMKAYKALADQQWKLARDLAGELSRLDGDIAAPHVIEGIAYLREGQKAEARSAFEKAKSLDGEDAEIAKLIQVTQ